jgi:hypothetical protein
MVLIEHAAQPARRAQGTPHRLPDDSGGRVGTAGSAGTSNGSIRVKDADEEPAERSERGPFDPIENQDEAPTMSEALAEVDPARHGETAWTLSGQHPGHTGLPLTGRGVRNAANLGDRLRGISFFQERVTERRRIGAQ